MNKSRNEIPTIDVNLVTITTRAGKEFGFDTANQIEVEIQTEESDAVKLVVKGILRAQKPKESTITGHQITLHDNVFNPELVKVLQGGKVLYFTDDSRTVTTEVETNFGFAGYTPPVAGSSEKGEVFELNAYSAIYNAAGVITGYEKTTYPNCQGEPVGFNSEDGAFRAPEYTINSAPDTGEPPYTITWVKELPVLDEPGNVKVAMAAEAPTTDMFGTLVSEMQEDVVITDTAITGTLLYLATGALVDQWGEGNFLAVKFDNIPADASSCKVGMEPSMGSGLVEIITDPDKNGAFKVTDKATQKFVIETTVDGKVTRQVFDLFGLKCNTH